MLHLDGLHRSLEWDATSGHFVQHHPQRINVTPAVQVRIPTDLLGRHIGRRAQTYPRLGVVGGGLQQFGDSKVGQQTATMT